MTCCATAAPHLMLVLVTRQGTLPCHVTPGHVAVPRDLAVSAWVQDAALVQYTRLTVNF